jgi:hypothetical protein
MEPRPRTVRLPFKQRTLLGDEKVGVRIQIFLPKLEGFSSDTRKDFLDLVRHFCRGIGCPQTISGQLTGFSNGVDHENWTSLIAHSSQTVHTPSELREPFPTLSGYAAPLWCKGEEIRNRSRCVRNNSYIWMVKSTAPCASVAGVRTGGAILRIALARQQPSVVHHILAPDPGGLPAFR